MDKKRIIHIDTKDSNSITDKVPQISGINLVNDKTSKVLDLRHIEDYAAANLTTITESAIDKLQDSAQSQSLSDYVLESIRKLMRSFIVLKAMLIHWLDINEIPYELIDDMIQCDILTEEENKDLLYALQNLSSAFIKFKGGLENILDDTHSSFKLRSDINDEIKILITNYTAFHENSWNKSYTYTIQEFIKTCFQTLQPDSIIVSDRLSAISLQDFQFALTTRPNPIAFIAPLGTGIFTNFRYDEKTRQVINVKTRLPVQETQTPTETASMMKSAAETVTTPDFVLLTMMYSILLKNATQFEGDNIIVPIQAFSKATGIDVSAGHAKDLEKKFALYDPYVGWINGQGLFAVLKFIKRDDTNGTFTFSAPYLNRLLSLVQQQGTRTYKNGRKAFLGHNELTHATIYGERNQTAAAVVIAIGDLLLQNRQQPDKKKGESYVVCHIAFSTLADYAELAPRIERTAATREKTRILKSCFTKAFELLRTKSDAYKYFDGLELYTIGKDGKKTFATVKGKNGELLDNLAAGNKKYNVIAPTFAGYNDILYIRHKGAKKNWKHDD